ncbi:MAG: TetR-like C-terminal domain-containing protein, partial [Hyphomicrobiaceae bacterium]
AVQARRVAREAECSVGTLYNDFGDIDGLVIADNATTLARLGEVVRAGMAATSGAPLRDRLEALARAYMRFAIDNQRRWEAVFKHRLPAGRPVPPSYVEDQTRLLAVLEDALSAVLAEPERRAFVARSLFGAVHGIVALSLDERLGGRLRPELEAQMAFIAELAARGLAAGAATAPLTEPRD